MRKLILMGLLIAIGIMYGQEPEDFTAPVLRGNFEVAGNVGISGGSDQKEYSSGSNYQYNDFGLSLSPEVSYFLLDHFSVGIAFQYQ